MNYLTAYLTSPSEPEVMKCWRPACRDEYMTCVDCEKSECPSCNEWTEQYDGLERCPRCGPSFAQLWPAFFYHDKGLEVFDAEWQADLYPHICKNHFGPVSVIYRNDFSFSVKVLDPVRRKEQVAC